MVEDHQEHELARHVAAEGWGCRDTLSEVHIGGDGRRTWRVGHELWLTASHDAGALGRENSLLARLGPVLDESNALFTVPAPQPAADGELTFMCDGLGWRATRHISGRRPDDDVLDTYRQSANTLRRLHEILRLLPDDSAVAMSVTDQSRGVVAHVLGSDWETVTNDPSERHDVIQMARWLATRLDALDQVPRQLVHGDWATPNLVMSPDDPLRIVAVLDWQFAMIGPTVGDLAQVQAASSVLMWSSFRNKSLVIREILDVYGDHRQSRLLGVAMGAFWFWNYWRGREELQREPRARSAMNRQPARLRTVLTFAREWENSVGL
jgi:Ser/Thr protein kinase RdoA (MazF antagonist)